MIGRSRRIIEIVADFVLATGPGVFTDKNIPIGHSINEVVHYCIISTILSQANLTLAILFIIDIFRIIASVPRTANQVIVIERVIYNITSGRTSYRVSDIIAQVNSRTIVVVNKIITHNTIFGSQHITLANQTDSTVTFPHDILLDNSTCTSANIDSNRPISGRIIINTFPKIL